jgi:hypothetical protein
VIRSRGQSLYSLSLGGEGTEITFVEGDSVESFRSPRKDGLTREPVSQIKGFAAMPLDASIPSPEPWLRKLLNLLIEANKTLAETFYFWDFLLRIDSETLFS